MFTNTVQPSIVSLFSSTSSEPLSLFSKQQDLSLAEDSFVHFVNDTSSLPPPPPPAVLCSMPAVDPAHDHSNFGYSLHQTVLHIQSPTLRTTFIQCPHSPDSGDLGLKHKWLHLQVRNLGREWSFEVGIVDKSGKRGVVRCSTFQKKPILIRASGPNTQPVLHLPISFPQHSSRPLTAWSTIALNIQSLIPHFSSLAIKNQPDDSDDDNGSRHNIHQARIFSPVPSGPYSHLSYIKVYATCRLRRIWLSESPPDSQVPWEFELYGP